MRFLEAKNSFEHAEIDNLAFARFENYVNLIIGRAKAG